MSGYSSAAEAAQRIMPWPAEHYGCRVVELGESSEDWAVSGHVSERRAKAAVMHYLRIDCGYTVSSLDRDVLAAVGAVLDLADEWTTPDPIHTDGWNDGRATAADRLRNAVAAAIEGAGQ